MTREKRRQTVGQFSSNVIDLLFLIPTDEIEALGSLESSTKRGGKRSLSSFENKRTVTNHIVQFWIAAQVILIFLQLKRRNVEQVDFRLEAKAGNAL